MVPGCPTEWKIRADKFIQGPGVSLIYPEFPHAYIF